MKIIKLQPDTRIFNKRLYRIDEFDHDWNDYCRFENEARKKSNPDYFEIYIDTDRTEIIHFFENQGFRFSEFKISRCSHLQVWPVSNAYSFPYKIGLISDQTGFNQILGIAAQSQFEDRFSKGTEVDKSLSVKRNLEFLKKSFRRKDEFLLSFFNEQTNRILGYQSGRFINKAEVELFLTGMTVDSVAFNCHEIFINLLHVWLHDHGVHYVSAVSSSVNRQELNIAFRSNQYEISSIKIGLCKWFSV